MRQTPGICDGQDQWNLSGYWYLSNRANNRWSTEHCCAFWVEIGSSSQSCSCFFFFSLFWSAHSHSSCLFQNQTQSSDPAESPPGWICSFFSQLPNLLYLLILVPSQPPTQSHFHSSSACTAARTSSWQPVASQRRLYGLECPLHFPSSSGETVGMHSVSLLSSGRT